MIKMPKFEQLTFDGMPVEQPSWSVRYKTLDNDHKIYFKIDWLTVMFFNVSINDILEWLSLGECVPEFLEGFFESNRALDRNFCFTYHGIRIEVPNELVGINIENKVFSRICPRIRLELSGSALDYLRSIGVDIDYHCKVIPKLPDGGDYHFTRVDYAFDFINYHPDFVDKVIDHCNTHSLPSGRIPICHQPSGLTFSVRTGGEKTVYLGSRQSDKLLRIYDKRMEQMDLVTQTWRKENPYGNPDSWFRLEWQLRNEVANNYVNSSARGIEILRNIFDTYAFADGTVSKQNRVPVDFWNTLFNWEEVAAAIIQNVKFVEDRTPEQKVYDTFQSIMIRTFMLFYSIYGKSGLQALCDRYLDGIYDITDPTSDRRRDLLLNKLTELSGSIYVDTDTVGFYRNSEGHLAFRLEL